jgi:Prokaryotic Cytochrome C oxidase subunit IV
MGAATNRRLLIVWLILSSITIGYAVLDRSVDHRGALAASSVVTASAILIALIKVRIIFREFMEVRRAPALLCRLTDAWILIMAGSLLASYFIGMAVA